MHDTFVICFWMFIMCKMIHLLYDFGSEVESAKSWEHWLYAPTLQANSWWISNVLLASQFFRSCSRSLAPCVIPRWSGWALSWRLSVCYPRNTAPPPRPSSATPARTLLRLNRLSQPRTGTHTCAPLPPLHWFKAKSNWDVLIGTNVFLVEFPCLELRWSFW